MPRFSTVVALVSLSLAFPAQAERGPVPGLTTATPYLIYYGSWTDADAVFARDNYKLVILHPSVSNVTPAQIATIQAGPDLTVSTDDDVPVLAYISVGEDDRPGAPFAGDGSGPRVDPRASSSDPLAGIAPLGDPSPGGTGFASYYLDDGVIGDPNSTAKDGQPDRNQTFGGYYTNPGDPAWFAILKGKTKAGTGRAGFDELLTSVTGNGYNCDGLFLDTLDTPAPNSFGATQFEWTTPAYQALVAQISAAYPAKLLLGNRGLFFYNPNLKNYEFTLRPYLDLVLFESYYTDSSGSGSPSIFFDDNKFNFAPKLNAESQRPDGFTILSLGYTTPGEPAALGPGDFVASQAEQGWLLYRTNPALTEPYNPFSTDAAAWDLSSPDSSPPTWDSSAARSADSDPVTPGNQAPAPRVGIQQAVAGDGEVTIRWDLARDQTGPVRYNIYHTDQPGLDFNTATRLAAVTPGVPENYLTGTGPGRFPFEFTVTGLADGTIHQFAVRAEDALGNEDSNTVVLSTALESQPSTFASITIDGEIDDWAAVPTAITDPPGDGVQDIVALKIANDEDYLYVLVVYNGAADTNTFNSSPSVFLSLDNDADRATGFDIYGLGSVGADVGWQNDFPFASEAGIFNVGATFTGAVPNIAPFAANTSFQEYRIARNATFSTGGGPARPVFPAETVGVAVWSDGGSPDFVGTPSYNFAPIPPYEAWKITKFTPAELADPLKSGALADLDLDGVPTFLEFAFDLEPKAHDAGKIPVPSLVTVGAERHLAINYPRRPPGSGIEYHVEASSDLSNWEDDPSQFVEISSLPLPNGLDAVTVRLVDPVRRGPLFLRLRVDLP